MARLEIRLIGAFEVTLDGQPMLGFESDRVCALLAYLAVESDRPHRREKLAGLLWPDLPEESARANLRRTHFSNSITINAKRLTIITSNQSTAGIGALAKILFMKGA